MFRTKKAGLLTKLVVLALLIYLAVSLLNLQGRIRETQAQRDSLSRQVAEQTQVNADLAEDVANPDDPERIADIARDKLGLVAPGEKVFIITS
ncbi:septum formation initiator family protein [uncultured Intestinimonas sp.]|uniref:FtsB family cell division protein n=1 Tax=uncultured Intestinimonas sp. TaxID=1689265 RepID=UPI0025E3AED8|nr:septum formation initiator family protein [uncultured Intestinimonas sp.]